MFRFRFVFLLPLLAAGSAEEKDCTGFYEMSVEDVEGRALIKLEFWNQSNLDYAAAYLTMDNSEVLPSDFRRTGELHSADSDVNNMLDFRCGTLPPSYERTARVGL